ncbi:MAG: quinone-dependent dihydroorotate dehydrogenase [Alphaproteobacteria bacterium]|nr:quinone-dependent dihydroorotate dehydrogenase [Alphaproteobacteria bacterium]
MGLYNFTRSILFALPPERAHHLALLGLKCGLVLSAYHRDDAVLATKLWGMDFPNPVGLAAGFDKNAEIPCAMLAQGFGFVETGTVTPKPQAGNPRPRLFRLVEDQAIINRMGFNNLGLETYARNLKRRAGLGKCGIVGANIGANKDSTDRIADYVTCLKRLLGLASYFTINISSPNTPGLRGLQDREVLDELLGRLVAVRAQAAGTLDFLPPLLVKIAPDLEADKRADIAAIVLKHGIDGVIVGNSTTGLRDHLVSEFSNRDGGLSGKPLFELSTELLADMYRLTGGKIPLIGVGGISSGADAYRKIRAGASLVQLYSALIFHGPGLVRTIKSDLTAALKNDGFSCLQDAVGCDVITEQNMTVTIFHNPKCSKSRQTLALLQQHGITPTVVNYLDDVPSAEKIAEILDRLGLEPRQLMRQKEKEYGDNNLASNHLSRDQLIAAMVAFPRLIERPIVLAGDKAAIGRPPENVLKIL